MNNELFINKKVWKNFSEDEMKSYLQSVYDYYREQGFPYFPTDMLWRENELKKLLNYDYTKCIDIDNKLIKQTMHGLSLCWSYHPHHYEIVCNNMRTVKETFEDDTLLKKVIEKRVRFGDNMSDNGLRKMIKVFSGTQCVSNFRPTAAAAIYSHFANKGDTVYDMSSGFGGRCLGAHISGVNYIGVDPSTKSYNGVLEMSKFLKSNTTLYNIGSEYQLPNVQDNTIDLAFTSPPYFDCEKYSEEKTQSYKKYPSKNEWLNGYMKDTLTECFRVLKSGKNLILNVQNVKTYKNLVSDVKHLAETLGFTLTDEWGLQLSRLGKGGYKTEPILIFKKN